MKSGGPPRSRSPQFAKMKADFKRAFGRRVFTLMLAKNWNQSDLAKHSGLGRDAISTYVRGRSFPEPVHLKKLAHALGVSMEDLENPLAGEETAVAGLTEIRAAEPGEPMARVIINELVPLEVAAKIHDLIKNSKK